MRRLLQSKALRTYPDFGSDKAIMRTVSVISVILATLSLSTIGAHAATWCAHYVMAGPIAVSTPMSNANDEAASIGSLRFTLQ
jgi:hypothetical protein